MIYINLKQFQSLGKVLKGKNLHVIQLTGIYPKWAKKQIFFAKYGFDAES